MKFSRLALGFGLLLLRPVAWAAAETIPPDPLQDCVSFHLGFEEGLIADRANGSEKPRSIGIQREGDKDIQPISNDEVVEQYLADGLVGKGLTNRDFKTRFWLPFSTENNLNPVHATILWWIKIVKPHPTAGGGMLFLQGGGYTPIQCAMSVKQREFYDVQIYTQANCTEWGRRTELAASFDRKAGVWTQLGLSWDKQFIYFIVNGKRVAAGTLKDPFTAHPFGPDFILGLFGWAAETDVAVMDEVTVYDRLLAPDELAMEHQRFAPPTDGTAVKIAAPSPGLRMESFFYPGVSRLRCELGYEGFRQPDEVKEARIIVKGPGDQEVGRWAVTRFEDQMASEIVELPKNLASGQYQVEASLHDAGGKLLSGPVRQVFEKRAFPFENNTIGISDKVLYPWTAMRCRESSGRSQVSVWNREYHLADTGFFKQVKSGAWDLLSQSVHLETRSAGKVLKWKGDGVKFGEKTDSAVDFTAVSTCEKIKAQVTVHSEFDGMFQYNLTLTPNGDGQVDGVDLVVPLKEEYAWLLHACSDGARGNSSRFTPRGEGRVWDSTKVRQWQLTGTFIPYLWLGDDRSGLCWWADSEKGWVRPAKKEDPSIEVRRAKGEVQMVFHLIGRPFQLKEPRTVVFAFNASPVRPRPEWARGWSSSTLAQDGFLLGPHLMVHGSCGWVSSNKESAPERPYTFCSLRPISDEADEWLRGFARQAHDAKQKLVVYTYLRGRAVDRGDEVKYYASEWDRRGVPHSAEETQAWKSYHGPGTGANMTRSRIDYDLWCMKHDADLGVDGFYFDEIFGSGQTNPAAGWGFKDENGGWEAESSLFPMRTYFKRLYTMLQERGVKEPVIMPHDTTTLYAGPMAFCTIPMELEAPQSDLLRGQVFGIGEAYMMCNVMAFQHGFAGSGMVCPSPLDAYRKGDYRIARTFLGGMLLFDSHPIFGVMPQEAYRMEHSLSKFGYDQPGVEYVPYWRAGDLQQVEPESVKVSLFRNGKKALLVMANDSPTAVKARWKPTAKFKHTGESMAIPDLEIINPQKITDPCWRPPKQADGTWKERQEPPPVKKPDGSWTLEIPPYDYRLIHTATEGAWGPVETWGPVDSKLFERNLGTPK